MRTLARSRTPGARPLPTADVEAQAGAGRGTGQWILGNCRIRPVLIPEIELDGGHVSYDVRPSERGRGRGHGKELLRLALVECRRLGLTRVLLTTAIGNEASIRVIRANGGVELDRQVSPFAGHTQIRWQIVL